MSTKLEKLRLVLSMFFMDKDFNHFEYEYESEQYRVCFHAQRVTVLNHQADLVFMMDLSVEPIQVNVQNQIYLMGETWVSIEEEILSKCTAGICSAIREYK